MKAINKDKAIWLLRHRGYDGFLPQALSFKELRMRNYCVNIIKAMDDTEVIPYDWIVNRVTHNMEVYEMVINNGGSEVFNISKEDIDYTKAKAFIDASKYILDLIKEYSERDDYNV